VHCNRAVRAYLTGRDAFNAVAEDVALDMWSAMAFEEDSVPRTATRLIQPMMKMMIPAEITTRQNARPSDSWLTASLLRLPSMLIPRTTIASARVTKPWAGLRSGQLRAKKVRKSENSEARRNTMRLLARKKPVGHSSILTACDSGEYVSDSVEEEELGRHRGLDEHDDAGRDDCQEGDDVHHTDAVEDDVAWPSQRLGGESHLAVVWYALFCWFVRGLEDATDLAVAVCIEGQVE
jgi:hypothetical protein